MRILIFHGYLLRGTGSNIYNASLARALASARTRGGPRLPGARAGELDLPEGVTVHVPDIGGVLPVYVADRYEGFDADPYAELDDAALERYIEANVAPCGVAARPPARRGAGQPSGHGPRDPGPGAGGPGALRGEGPRQRAGVHGAAAAASASCPTPWRACAGPAACWWARATPPRACGRCWPRSRRCPRSTRLRPARGGRAHLPARGRPRRRPPGCSRLAERLRGRQRRGLGRRGRRGRGAGAARSRRATGS